MEVEPGSGKGLERRPKKIFFISLEAASLRADVQRAMPDTLAPPRRRVRPNEGGLGLFSRGPAQDEGCEPDREDCSEETMFVEDDDEESLEDRRWRSASAQLELQGEV